MKTQTTLELEDLRMFARVARTRIMLCAGLALLILLAPAPCRAQDEEAGDGAPEVMIADEPDVVVPPPTLPAHIHCGQLLKIEKQEFGVDAVDLDKVLAQNQLDPAQPIPEGVVSQRGCPDGKVLAICHFSIAPKRSISKHDYVLECDGEDAVCLAMAMEGKPFDARLGKIARTGVARLLFDVPATATTLTLRPALITRVPLAALKDLPFGQAVEAIEEEPEKKGEGEAAEDNPDEDAQPEAESKP
ncbi:MAG: hypothetical protein KAI66_06610 [Lentisphaeria bacterium]|nr:hypothetical protein [Lentisphaeria bacterium]